MYNWPVYVLTWAAAAAGWAAHARGWAPATMACLATGPLLWSSLSLAVSWYIYDRSALQGGTWVRAQLPAQVHTWATVHAGLDAEVQLRGVMPGACAGRLDIFDPSLMPAGSITRARRHARAPVTSPRPWAETSPHVLEASSPTALPEALEALSKPCPPTALALADSSCDAIIVAFSAHEIVDPGVRQRFFAELRRALRPGGRVVLVEHVRDMPNFLVFGPGCMHFLPRQEWLRLASAVGLRVVKERRITPWVMVLSLETPP